MLISIVIPVKNGLKWLQNSLPIFLSQKLDGELEIILLDSGSNDGLHEFLNQKLFYNVFIYQIDPNNFNHGETRNYGVKMARGKYVLMTVQDAKPRDENFLQQMLDGFIDEEVVAVCGQQIVPHDLDKNPLEWYRPINKPDIQVVKFNQGEFKKLSGHEQLKYCGWDNVISMYKKNILLTLPFEKTKFAEDLIWAKFALLNGYKLSYNKFAKIYHYHHHNHDFTVRRVIIEWYCKYKIFNVLPQITPLTINRFLGWIKFLILEKKIPIGKKIFWLYFNLSMYKSYKIAYNIWIKFQNENDLEKIEDLYFSKIPIGNTNV